MIINRYLIAYFLFSVLGWVWESIYCTAKEKKWQNRGFLYGPLCPIYGAGAIIGLLYWDLNASGIIPDLSWLGVFVAGFIVSMILEYPTSYILEKKFNARWWDYTTVPLNIKRQNQRANFDRIWPRCDSNSRVYNNRLLMVFMIRYHYF